MAEPTTEVSLRKVGRSAVILTGASVAVQLVGITRELFVAAQVGLSRNLDALLIALVVPTTLSSLLTSGSVTALIPAYVDARTTQGLKQARLLAGTVLSWTALGAAVVVLVALLLGHPLVAILGPGLDTQSRQSAAMFLVVLAPVAFFACIAGLLTAVCQAEEHFGAIALATFASPVATVVTLIALWRTLALGAYALGSLLGPMVEGTVLLGAAIHYRIVPIPGFRMRGLGLRAFGRHAWPLTASSSLLQLNLIADRAIASLLAPGAVSALRYADVLVRSPISAIAPAWSSAMYPAQVKAAAIRGGGGLGLATARSIGFALAVFVPIAALIAALAPLGVQVAYARGAFASTDIFLTAGAVAAFAPLIVMRMVSPVLAGAHNARRHGLVLLATGVMNVAMNFVLDVVLGTWLGVAGVALSSSVTATILVVFLARRLAATEEDFAVRPLVGTTARALVAVSAPAAFAAALAWTLAGRWATLPAFLLAAVLGLSAISAYGVVALRYGPGEVRVVIALASEYFHRRRLQRPADKRHRT